MGHAHYPTARNVAASARGRGIPLVAACPTSDALMLGSWPQKRSTASTSTPRCWEVSRPHIGPCSSTWCNGRGGKVQEAKERDKAKRQNQSSSRRRRRRRPMRPIPLPSTARSTLPSRLRQNCRIKRRNRSRRRRRSLVDNANSCITMLTASKNEEPEGGGGASGGGASWAGQSFPISDLQMAAGGVPQ